MQDACCKRYDNLNFTEIIYKLRFIFYLLLTRIYVN